MEFAVMTWVSDNVKVGSIFGVLDSMNPKVLPTVSKHGFWADFRNIDESRFQEAARAKAAIAKDGYYLIGASVTVEEVFGSM
jgi:hypothetical protein